MKKILPLLMVITVFFSLSAVPSANTVYVVGMDTTRYNDLVPEGFTLKSDSLMRYSHANSYLFLSSDSNNSVNLLIGIYPDRDKLIISYESFLKMASDNYYYQNSDDSRVVGDVSWNYKKNSKTISFARNNVYIRLYSRSSDSLALAKHIDDLILNQKPPFKYSKTPPSAPIPKIPKKINNNENTWKKLFKDKSGWYEVVTNGQAIYRKDPENNKETFELARKTGKVKLTINIVTDDNLFDTKEVETEIVP